MYKPSEYKELNETLIPYNEMLSHTNRLSKSILDFLHRGTYISEEEYDKFSKKITKIGVMDKSILDKVLIGVEPDSTESHGRKLGHTFSSIMKEREKSGVMHEMMRKHLHRAWEVEGDVLLKLTHELQEKTSICTSMNNKHKYKIMRISEQIMNLQR